VKKSLTHHLDYASPYGRVRRNWPIGGIISSVASALAIASFSYITYDFRSRPHAPEDAIGVAFGLICISAPLAGIGILAALGTWFFREHRGIVVIACALAWIEVAIGLWFIVRG
jgi:hypothetical protein